ncbi:MAG: phosphatase PAP2 family protein [Polyangiaceae bacterium]
MRSSAAASTLLLSVALTLHPSVAGAQSPEPVPVEDPAASQPLPGAGSAQETQFKPPAAPPPVPTPSPVVIAGEPTPPGTAVAPLVWQRTRFGTFDYVVTVAGAAGTLAAAIVKPRAQHAVGPVLVDEEVRDALRPTSLSVRYKFRDASDVGLSLAVTWPFFVDSLVTAWWYRGSRDVAEQMALVDLEALALIGGIQGATNVLVSRERPYGKSCGGDLPSDAFDCSGSTHYRSFFSGHTAFAFTGAALVCFHHLEQELLGSPWDGVSCAGAYAVAAATGTFRLVGDVHYLSDVLAGAALGTIVGYSVPLLHFPRSPPAATVRRTGRRERVDEARVGIVPTGLGAGVAGVF